MRELNNVLDIRDNITVTEQLLCELISQNISPKNQIISDMPKGGGMMINPLESYIIRKEKLEKRLERQKRQLNEQWDKAVDKFNAANISKPEQDLMKYRFYYGYTWKICAIKMQMKYKGCLWNENKVYRVYRGIMHKTSMNFRSIC